MIEFPHPLERACSNCPEPAGGRGTLRRADGNDVVSCAICHTPNFARRTPVPQQRDELPEFCPDCRKRLVAQTGPCPNCGLTEKTINAVREVQRLYAEAAADLATT